MAHTYTGNAANLTPNTAVTVTLPDDLDPASAASVDSPGPFQFLADIGAFVAQLGVGIPGLNPTNLPAALAVNWGTSNPPSGVNHYQLLGSYIFGSGSHKNLRLWLRDEDGALVISQNCYPGTGNAWHQDDSGSYSSALFIGGGIYPGVEGSGQGSAPFGGGFAFATRTASLGGAWTDIPPNYTSLSGWTGLFHFQGINPASGGGSKWAMGAPPQGGYDSESSYAVILGDDTTGVIDYYGTAPHNFHGQQLTGVAKGGFSALATLSGHLSDAVAVGQMGANPGPSSGGGAVGALPTFSGSNVNITLGTSGGNFPSGTTIGDGKYCLFNLFGGLLVQAGYFTISPGSPLTVGDYYYGIITFPTPFSSGLVGFFLNMTDTTGLSPYQIGSANPGAGTSYGVFSFVPATGGSGVATIWFLAIGQ